jgi:hypothetical protein
MGFDITARNWARKALNLLSSVPTLSSNTYSPSATGVTNVTTVTPQTAQYSRNGSTVTVSGRVDVTATATGNTTFRMTLPVASNFASTGELAGGAFYATNTVANNSFARISADTTNDEASFAFNSTVNTSASWFYHFTYTVI